MIDFAEKPNRIVYTYGVFDLIHPGHIAFLGKCKALGDFLIVGVVLDKEIRTVKDPKKPIMPENWRLELLQNIKAVDYVLYQETYDPADNLLLLAKEGIKVDVLAKGDDMFQIKGVSTIEKLGGKFVAPSYTSGYSTSEIIGKIVERYCG